MYIMARDKDTDSNLLEIGIYLDENRQFNYKVSFSIRTFNKIREDLTFSDSCYDFVNTCIIIDEKLKEHIYTSLFEKDEAIRFTRNYITDFCNKFGLQYVED